MEQGGETVCTARIFLHARTDERDVDLMLIFARKGKGGMWQAKPFVPQNLRKGYSDGKLDMFTQTSQIKMM